MMSTRPRRDRVREDPGPHRDASCQYEQRVERGTVTSGRRKSGSLNAPFSKAVQRVYAPLLPRLSSSPRTMASAISRFGRRR
jgi:hypothetical protein